MTAVFAGVLAAAALLWFLLVEFPAFRYWFGVTLLTLVAIVAALSLTGQVIYQLGKRTNRWNHR